MTSSGWVAGVDGFRGGWFVVMRHLASRRWEGRRIARVDELLTLPGVSSPLVIDMVIGLPATAERGGRACDRAARKLLGRPRSSSVFSPPVRAALEAEDYREALAVNRAHSPDGLGFSIEAFNLFPKLRAVDAVLTPAVQERIVEGHPELAFYAMNADRPAAHSKHRPAGRAERIALLGAHGFAELPGRLGAMTGGGVKVDDVLDACALCWTAERLARDAAVRLPRHPPRDARGLRMEIWR